MQVQVLPGALKSEVVMRGLISLLRNPDDGYALSRIPPDPPEPLVSEEPDYFVALLAYLRQRRQEIPEGSAQHPVGQPLRVNP